MRNKFFTVSKPRSHHAEDVNGRVFIAPQPTEIDLVRRLTALGIKLEDFFYESSGEGFNCTVFWSKS